jgi:hypothetical protein
MKLAPLPAKNENRPSVFRGDVATCLVSSSTMDAKEGLIVSVVRVSPSSISSSPSSSPSQMSEEQGD